LITTLEILYLHVNELSGTVPSDLGLLENLQEMWLVGNDLTGEIPDEICTLPITNGGAQTNFGADCEEIDCPCCTFCCVDGLGCTSIVEGA